MLTIALTTVADEAMTTTFLPKTDNISCLCDTPLQALQLVVQGPNIQAWSGVFLDCPLVFLCMKVQRNYTQLFSYYF